MGIPNIIALITGIALFLFGMNLMGDSLKQVAGHKLEVILWRLSRTPLKGILFGALVTAAVQSSSATTIMVVGFVNSGMMQLAQAIGVIMGANIGTSITEWILCLSLVGGNSSPLLQLLSISTLTAALGVIGIILRMFCKTPTKKHVGEILLGFAVLMFGMATMSGSVAVLRDNAAFINFFTVFSNPLLGILIGIVFTAILQSSSAACGILQALSLTGAIPFSTALPIIMGIGIGASTPVLLSAIGASKNGKRTALIYLFNDLFGAIIWGIVFYALNYFIHFGFMSATVGPVYIALTNNIYRVLTVLVLAFFIPLLEKLVCWLVKDDPAEKAAEMDIDRLEERFIIHPALAIEQSRIALSSMAERSQSNLILAFKLLTDFSWNDFNALQEDESIVDRYEDKLGTYLVKVSRSEMTHDQNKRVFEFLHIIGDFERISDHAVNISKVAREITEKKVTFSSSAQRELAILQSAVTEIVAISMEAFIKDDREIAFRVEPLEELIDILCDEIKMRHIDRVQAGSCSLGPGFIFNDLLTNYERVADHCSNIAALIIQIEADNFDQHEYLNRMKELRTHNFNKYFEEYSRKYVLDKV
ncbi:MAG: Na/Pi cotransporter family protein [Oscillospiraceae bacterium]|nr:Na/Pi cotransporter family protein [Oscillospiraceae bacterium]